MGEKINRRGQVALWVILGVILAASVLLFFALTREPTITRPLQGDVSFDVQSYLQECVGEHVEEAVGTMLPQGGFITPRNPVYFDNTYIEYLCENVGLYEPCINQHPMFMYDLKKEIKEYLLDELRMRRCLDEFIIEGIETTIPFHKKVFRNKKFISGKYDTHFLDHFKIKKVKNQRSKNG